MEQQPSLPLPLPGVVSKEGTAYRLRSGGYRPKPEVELVVIRLFFGPEENPLKTFWWVARDELNNEEVAGGRLMVTNMREAISAARYITRQQYRIRRCREETYSETQVSLEEWGLRYMDLLARYALPGDDESSGPEEYHQPTLF
jgi:hypothetical protein